MVQATIKITTMPDVTRNACRGRIKLTSSARIPGLARHVPNAITRIDDSGGHQMDPETRIGLLYNWLLNGGDLA